MNGVGRVGPGAGSPGARGPDKPEKKKGKGPSFDDVLKKKAGAEKSDEAGSRTGRAPLQAPDGKKGGAAGSGSGESESGRAGKGGASVSDAGRVGRSGPGTPEPKGPKGPDAGTDDRTGGGSFGKVLDRESKKTGPGAEESAGAQQVAQPGAAPPTAGPQEAKPAAKIPPALMNKIVESVRVGQNREGAMEVQMDLKATVFEGMSLKVSRGPDGTITTTLIVDQLAAKDALQAEAAQLASRLEAQGLSVREVQVELREQPAGGAQGEAAGGQAGEGSRSGGGGAAEGREAGPGGPAGPGDAPGGGASEGPSAPPRKDRGSRTDYSI